MKLKIYQIKDLENCPYSFMRYEFAKKHNFNIKDYDVVWEEEIDSDIDLEDIFTRFNIDHPEGYKGHSLSVSDIVDLDGSKFYCDPWGFKDITADIEEELA